MMNAMGNDLRKYIQTPLPKKTGDIVWRFTKAGEFDFSCLIPGHREAGMSGKIIVK